MRVCVFVCVYYLRMLVSAVLAARRKSDTLENNYFKSDRNIAYLKMRHSERDTDCLISYGLFVEEYTIRVVSSLP